MVPQTGERWKHIYVESEWICYIDGGLKVSHGAIEVSQSGVCPSEIEFPHGSRINYSVQPIKVLLRRTRISSHSLHITPEGESKRNIGAKLFGHIEGLASQRIASQARFGKSQR